MKKYLNFKNITKHVALGALVLIALGGCKKDDQAFDPNLSLATESLSVSNQANDYSVGMVSNSPWTAESDVEWITINSASGEKGKGTIQFSVAKSTEDERTGTITVSTSGDHKKQITITQETGLSSDLYVKEGGTGDGSSWQDATSLANALQLIPSGSTIYIAAGTYLPTQTVTGGNSDDNRDITFEISKYITLKGGYPANATDGAVADPVNNKTLLSGKLANGSETYHVVTVSTPKIDGQKVVIDGLTISHGNGFDRGSKVNINGLDFPRGNGGGMSIGNAVVEILNTDIVDNKTSGTGSTAGYSAGVFAFGGSVVTFKNSKINDNESAGNGGGLYVDRSIAYIYDSEINRNSGGTAAGVHGYPDSEIYMYNSTVADNKGRSYGAGFYIRQNSKAVLVNCLITGNVTTAKNGGGGVMMYNNSEANIISSTIVENSVAIGPGGGIFADNGVNKLNVYNSIISGNIQLDDGPDINSGSAAALVRTVKSSVVGKQAYDQNGNEITGATFNINTMLNASYLPIGTDNPALNNGMTGTALTALGDTFNPILEAFISSDFNGKSRAGVTIMGALVQ